MKIKFFKFILFIILFFNLTIIEADTALPFIDTDYNTVYRGDIIELKIGLDCKDFNTMVSKETGATLYGYKMHTIYFDYDNTVFDVDLRNLKIEDDDYILIDYFEKKYEDRTLVYFDFDIKRDYRTEEEIKYYYNDEDTSYSYLIDNLIISNIKLKVKNNVESATYYLSASKCDYNPLGCEYSSSEGWQYFISVIDEKNVEESIDNITFKTQRYYENSDVQTKTIDIQPGKYDYEVSFFQLSNNLDVFANCNSRCKISGIGGIYYLSRVPVNFRPYEEPEYWNYEFSVKYSSGKTAKYTVMDRFSKASISTYAMFDDSDYYILGNSSYEENILGYEDKFKSIYLEMHPWTSSAKIFYYNYDELNDVDKEILSLIKSDIDVSSKPLIFYVSSGKLIYEHQGFIESDEDWKKIMIEVSELTNHHIYVDSNFHNNNNNINFQDNIINSSHISDVDKCCIVIGSIIIVVLIILIIVMIIKGKRLKVAMSVKESNDIQKEIINDVENKINDNNDIDNK